MIPQVVSTIILRLCSLLQLHQGLNLPLTASSKAGTQITQELVHGLWSLGHLIFNTEGSVVGVSQQASSLVTQHNRLPE